MNRILRLKQDLNISSISNNSTISNNGYETAVEDSSDTSMYYSMNEKTLIEDSIATLTNESVFSVESGMITIKENNISHKNSVFGSSISPNISSNVSILQTLSNNSTLAIGTDDVNCVESNCNKENQCSGKKSSAISSIPSSTINKIQRYSISSSFRQLKEKQMTGANCVQEKELSQSNGKNEIQKGNRNEVKIMLLEDMNQEATINLPLGLQEQNIIESIVEISDSSEAESNIGEEIKIARRSKRHSLNKNKRKSIGQGFVKPNVLRRTLKVARKSLTRVSITSSFRQTQRQSTNKQIANGLRRSSRLTMFKNNILSQEKSEKPIASTSGYKNESHKEVEPRTKDHIMPLKRPAASVPDTAKNTKESSIAKTVNKKNSSTLIKEEFKSNAITNARKTSIQPIPSNAVVSNLKAKRMSSISKIVKPAVDSSLKDKRKTIMSLSSKMSEPLPVIKPLNERSAVSQKLCNICNETFRLESKLKSHMKVAHNITKSLNECKYCNKSFALNSALLVHQQKNCSKISFEERKKLLFSPLNTKNKSKQRQTKNENLISLKEASNTENDLFSVPKNVSSKSKHRPAHSGIYRTPNKPIRCEVCKSVFFDILTYTTHAEEHSTDNNTFLKGTKLF